MGKSRLEAFSDGVIAIIITIMVLEMHPPHSTSLAALTELWPVFLSYALSFVNVGIFWNNHHHMLHAVHKVTGGILWANLHLLFWLSLLPFASGWMGQNHFAALPTAVYAGLLAMCGIAYGLLQSRIVHSHGQDSVLARALGADAKGKATFVANALAMLLAWFGWPAIAGGLMVLTALMWLVPDRRIERELRHQKPGAGP